MPWRTAVRRRGHETAGIQTHPRPNCEGAARAAALLYFPRFRTHRGAYVRRTLLQSLVFLAAALISGLAAAEASLFVYPTLVMFEGNRTSAEVTIANRGDEIGTFEIAWANMSMTPEGGLIRHEEAVAWSIQPFLRYSPRRVTLAPAESQVIRIALRRGDTVPEGEYFAHMRVVTINSASVQSVDEQALDAEPGISITARSAIAIPVIWRNSQAIPAATIESIEVDADLNAIEVEVARRGLLSARGFIHVIAGGGSGETSVLAEPMPLILYPNIERRSVSIPLLEGNVVDSLPADAAIVYSADEELTERSLVYSNRRIVPEQ